MYLDRDADGQQGHAVVPIGPGVDLGRSGWVQQEFIFQATAGFTYTQAPRAFADVIFVDGYGNAPAYCHQERHAPVGSDLKNVSA